MEQLLIVAIFCIYFRLLLLNHICPGLDTEPHLGMKRRCNLFHVTDVTKHSLVKLLSIVTCKFTRDSTPFIVISAGKGSMK